MSKKKKAKRVVIISDLHSGAATGLTSPTWQIMPQKGTRAKTARSQKILWEFYAETIDSLKPIDVLLINGDAIDGRGERSGGTELIFPDRSDQAACAAECIQYAEAKKVVMTYGCLAPQHKILTADLRWVPAGDLAIGTPLVGFDESPVVPGAERKWCESYVTANATVKRECARLRLSDGTEIVATLDHPFLVRSGRPLRWTTVRQMCDFLRNRNGSRSKEPHLQFHRFLPVWGTDTTYEGGYLAGFLDGEGSCSYGTRKRKDHSGKPEFTMHLGGEQNENEMLGRVAMFLRQKGIKHSVKPKGTRENAYHVAILGSMPEKLAVLGSLRPPRLLSKPRWEAVGSVRSRYKDETRVVDIEPIGPQWVAGLSTTAGTYVSEGFLSHNTGYHVGDQEDWEAVLAKEIGAKISAQEWVEVNGLVFDVKHHVGGSTIPHGRHTAVARERLWSTLWAERGQAPKSDIIVRSHIHYFNYCGGPDWLAITTPALQGLGTKYGARKMSGTVDYGLIHFDVTSQDTWTWNWHIASLIQKSRITHV